MKNKVSLLLGLLAIIAVEAHAADLPITDIQKEVAEFKTYNEAGRRTIITFYKNDYTDNQDVEVAQNLVDYAKEVKKVLAAEASKQESVIEALNLLLDQSLEQIGIYGSLAKIDLISIFNDTITQRSRYKVMRFWHDQLYIQTDVALVQKLRAYFNHALAKGIEAKYDDYFTKDATSYSDAANNKLNNMGITAPKMEFPVVDVQKAIKDFTAFQLAEKRALLDALMRSYNEKSATNALKSIIEFSTALIATLEKTPDTQKDVLDLAKAVLSETNKEILKRSDLTLSEMNGYYSRIATLDSVGRRSIIDYWNEQIPTLTTKADADKLISFFRSAAKVSIKITATTEINEEDVARLISEILIDKVEEKKKTLTR